MKQIIFLSLVLIGLRAFAQDFSYDKQIGAEAATQVEMFVGIYRDSLLTDYVEKVGSRLINSLGAAPVDFQFKVVDMPEPNAFALPGGYIYVSRGLLCLLNDESELAGVMGHEMIHVTKRHSIKQMKKSILPSILRIPGALVGGLVNENLGNLINAPVNFASDLFIMSYSRKQEREADRLGIKLAAGAGYDPSKLAAILDGISSDMERRSGEAEKKSYFSTHPYTPKRHEDILENAAEISWSTAAPIARTKSELFRILNGIVYDSNPEQGVFKENLLIQPELDFTMTFPKKWEFFNFPVSAGAMQPDGQARIILSGSPGFSEPDSAGIAFVKFLHDNFKIKPEIIDSTEINGNPAYVVSFNDNDPENNLYYKVCWIKNHDILYQITGITTSNYKEVCWSSMESFRPLKEGEEKISVERLRIATAKNGETLTEFNIRTGNAWDVKTTSLINGLGNKPLMGGQPVKYLSEEIYQPEK